VSSDFWVAVSAGALLVFIVGAASVEWKTLYPKVCGWFAPAMPRMNLVGSEQIVQVILSIKPDGSWAHHVSRTTLTQEEGAHVCRAVLNAALALNASAGVSVGCKKCGNPLNG